MKKSILILILYVIGSNLNGQELMAEWAISMGGSGFDQGFNLAVDEFGNSYVTGRYTGTVDFDPGPGVTNLNGSGRDVFITKHNNLGELLWAIPLSGSGNNQSYAIGIDQNRNVYVCGRFTGSLDFDPGPGNSTLSGQGGGDIFIAKYTEDGDFIWVKQMGGTSTHYGYAMWVSPNGEVYTTGRFSGSGDFDPGPGVANLNVQGAFDVFVSKLDANGDFLWVKQFAGSKDVQAYSICGDLTGNIFCSGRFAGTVDFTPAATPTTMTAPSGFDMFIAKLTPAGALSWVKQWNGSGNYADWAYSTTTDQVGNVIVTGIFSGTEDFDPGIGTANFSSIGGYDVFVLKLDGNGNYIWAKHFEGSGDDMSYSIRSDNSNNLYVAGWFDGNFDLDPTGGSNIVNSKGGDDIFIVKLDPNGIQLFGETIGGSSGNEQGVSFDANNKGDLYLTGMYHGVTDLDPSSLEKLRTSNGDHEYFIVKLVPESVEVNLGKDTSFCQGDSIKLSSRFPQYVNTWNTGSNESEIWIKQSGKYWVDVQIGGDTKSDTIMVTTHPKPSVYVGPDTAFCNLFSHTIQAKGDTIISYKWNTGESSDFIVVEEEGIYHVQVQNKYSCPNADTVQIDYTEVNLTFDGDSLIICNENNVLINVIDPGNESYTWSNGLVGPNITVSNPGWYYVTANNMFCEAKDSIYVGYDCPPLPVIPNIFIPNGFTPNKLDGVNDVFLPQFSEPLEHFNLKIYNRWGEKLFESDSEFVGWNGTYKGKLCPNGIYVYIIEYRGLIGRKYVKSGTVSIIE